MDDWEVRERDAELARTEVEQALPPGWKLGKSDPERYTTPTFKLDTYSAAAVGPSGATAVVIALDEATAWRALLRRIRGELETTDVWAPSVPSPAPPI